MMIVIYEEMQPTTSVAGMWLEYLHVLKRGSLIHVFFSQQKPGSLQQVWQGQRLCGVRVETQPTVGGRHPSRNHHHHGLLHSDEDGDIGFGDPSSKI